MLYFKTPQGDEVFAYATTQDRERWGAPELVAMSQAEVLAHRAAASAIPAAAQIEALERDHMLPKATRKFMLMFMETTAIQQGAGQGLTPEQSLAALTAGNPGYAAVKALDNQIEALEALL